MEQFKTGLAENGLVEGRNIAVDYFWGEGKRERLQQLAAELAQRDLDVIVTVGPQPLRALIEARTNLRLFLRFLMIRSATDLFKTLHVREATSRACQWPVAT
jgi:putative ABC transport system substrate-binding protein